MKLCNVVPFYDGKGEKLNSKDLEQCYQKKLLENQNLDPKRVLKAYK